ncbi:LOW QUALITY PROTEIN: protein LTV1 homolog [Ptychodera flava]|uniref:LOW QUALITY PROTEIN: protein LTV1 homolog n=1 Tax=Ptychodera flava TaxID=63121 RepID=UPI00396A4516
MGANESQQILTDEGKGSSIKTTESSPKSNGFDEKARLKFDENENGKKKKPGKKSKKFIDKKKAANFQLVHRSQRDPLQADDESSQHVLRPVESADEDKRKDEQRQYGVYYDDDYNYLQHLKETNPQNVLVSSDKPVVPPRPKPRSQEPKIQLPASAFGSKVEEKTGMLNKAAPISGPRLDLDPDVVAAMDDDFNFENPDNELDDDFVVKASEATDGEPQRRATIADIEEMADLSDADYGSDEGAFDDLDSGGAKTFSDEETKSKFTNYSMTSSVIKRNEGLTLLDDRFEKVYEQYDDDEIGALDHEELAGNIHTDSDLLQSVLSEFERQQKEKVVDFAAPSQSPPPPSQADGDTKTKERGTANETEAVSEGEGEDRKGLPDFRKDIIDINYDDDYSTSSSEDELVAMVTREPKEEWDCETILSTHSNLYNHPTTIKEPPKPKPKPKPRIKPKPIELSQKTGIPKGVLPAKGAINNVSDDDSDTEESSTRPVPPPRRKNETPEEKRERKQIVKTERRERRVEKKANKEAFKAEEQRQQQVMMNLQQNLQGVKLT